MTKKEVRGIQTALWAVLILVQMSILSCLEVHAETVRKEVTYRAIEEKAELPQEITVSVMAEADEEDVSCQAVEWMEEASYWQEDFSFPLTFYEYGADGYRLGDQVIKAEDLSVFAGQYGEEILSDMGLSTEEYEVTDLSWSGELYRNEEGVLCRDAQGHGRRLLRDYRVVYEGIVDPERWKELQGGGRRKAAELRRETKIPAQEETKMQETEPETENTVAMPESSIAESAEPRPVAAGSKIQEFLEKITKIFLVAVGIGAVFFFGGLLLLAGLRIGRKLREHFGKQ